MQLTTTRRILEGLEVFKACQNSQANQLKSGCRVKKRTLCIALFQRRRIAVSGIDYQWQANLIDMTKLKKFNNGHMFVLIVIDVFSNSHGLSL